MQWLVVIHEFHHFWFTSFAISHQVYAENRFLLHPIFRFLGIEQIQILCTLFFKKNQQSKLRIFCVTVYDGLSSLKNLHYKRGDDWLIELQVQANT